MNKPAYDGLLGEEKVTRDELMLALIEDLYPSINSAMTAASVLRNRLTDPETRTLLDAVCDSLSLLTRLTDNMRDLTLSGNETLPMSELDWAVQLHALIRLLAPYADREGCRLEADLPDSLWVEGSIELSERVLLWLLTSLLRTGIGEGTLTLTLIEEDDCARLLVRDSRPCQGLGRAALGEGELNSLTAEKKTGLYLSRCFCRRMGWTLTPESEGETAGLGLTAPLARGLHQLRASACGAFEQCRLEARIQEELSLLFGRL